MKFTCHIELTPTGFNLSPYNKAYLLSFAQNNKGEGRLILETRKKKSSNALGLYWGGIIPALVAHDKSLLHQGALTHNPFILAELIKAKKITKDDIDIKHRDIMFTLRPDMAKDLKTGQTHRIGQLLRENDNEYLIDLITEIYEMYEPEGYELPDPDLFKQKRDKPDEKSDLIENYKPAEKITAF